MSDGIAVHIHVNAEDASVALAVAEQLTASMAKPERCSHGIKVREVPGGVVLDVPNEVRKQLLDFGWLPPAGA